MYKSRISNLGRVSTAVSGIVRFGVIVPAEFKTNFLPCAAISSAWRTNAYVSQNWYHHFIIFEAETKFIAISKGENGLKITTTKKNELNLLLLLLYFEDPEPWVTSDCIKDNKTTRDILNWLQSTSNEGKSWGQSFLKSMEGLMYSFLLNDNRIQHGDDYTLATNLFNEFSQRQNACWRQHCLTQLVNCLNTQILSYLRSNDNSLIGADWTGNFSITSLNEDQDLLNEFNESKERLIKVSVHKGDYGPRIPGTETIISYRDMMRVAALVLLGLMLVNIRSNGGLSTETFGKIWRILGFVDGYLHHHFVIFESESWAISVSKDTNGVKMIIAAKEQLESLLKKNGANINFQWASDEVNGLTTEDIEKWIDNTRQSERTYHVADANCGHFATEIFNDFANMEKISWDRYCYETYRETTDYLSLAST